MHSKIIWNQKKFIWSYLNQRKFSNEIKIIIDGKNYTKEGEKIWAETMKEWCIKAVVSEGYFMTIFN